MTMATATPAPPPERVPLWKFIGPMLKLRAGDLKGVVEGASQLGDIWRTGAGPMRIVFLNHPDYIQELLVKNHKSYKKDQGFRALQHILGKGLLTSEGEFHLRQRRLIQPAFHKGRITAYGETMVDYAARMSGEWQDAQPIDLYTQMMRVTLQIIGKTLFNADVEKDAQVVADSLDDVIRYHERYAFELLGKIFDALPLESTRKFNAGLQALDETMYRIIDEHRALGTDNGDLLSMLLLAQYEDDGSTMSNQQVRDESITLFLAGHETTAIAMTWTWYLLSQHPEVEAQLHAELDEVLGGQSATAADVARLTYTRQVFAESMRMYPPAYGFGREALEDNTIGGHRIRKGDTVVVSPYILHYDARYFDEPDAFRPDRWAAGACEGLHKFAYFPFGGGARKCIGEPFAWMEGILLLATFAQQWKFRLAPDAQVAMEPRITLRPKHGMKMIAHRRAVRTAEQ